MSAKRNLEHLDEYSQEMLSVLYSIEQGLHRAANGGSLGAGEKWTVGKLKRLLREYRDKAAEAITKAENPY